LSAIAEFLVLYILLATRAVCVCVWAQCILTATSPLPPPPPPPLLLPLLSVFL